MQSASRSTTVTCFFSFMLVFALIVSLFAPFAIKRVKASSGETIWPAKEKALVPAMTPVAQGTNRREGELLVMMRRLGDT